MLWSRFSSSLHYNQSVRTSLILIFDWNNFVQKGRTALICAADKGHVECVEALLKAGADKHAQDNVRICGRLFEVIRYSLGLRFTMRSQYFTSTVSLLCAWDRMAKVLLIFPHSRVTPKFLDCLRR